MDTKTQKGMQIEMSYRRNQGQAKIENVQATVDQCATNQMKSSGPWEKCKKIWTRLIKPISVISAFHIFTEKQLNFWIIRIYLDYENFVMQDLL